MINAIISSLFWHSLLQVRQLSYHLWSAAVNTELKLLTYCLTIPSLYSFSSFMSANVLMIPLAPTYMLLMWDWF